MIFVLKTATEFSIKIYNWLHKNVTYSHANWKKTEKLSLTCFKNILKVSHSNFAVIYPWNLLFSCSLLFNSFCCPFCLQTKLYGSVTYECKNISLYYFFWSDRIICYYICMTASLRQTPEKKIRFCCKYSVFQLKSRLTVVNSQTQFIGNKRKLWKKNPGQRVVKKLVLKTSKLSAEVAIESSSQK